MSEEHHVWGVNHARPQDAAEVARLARVIQRPTVVVGIDGPAGSGKSSLAQLVSRALDDAPVVHLDDIFPGWDGLAAAPVLVTAQVLAALDRGERATYRRFDWETGRFAELAIVPEHPYIVLEGCACTVGIARPYVDVRVWVEAQHDTRMRRGLERQGDQFGPHWERWARQEQAVFTEDDTRAHAHQVVTTD